MIRDVSFLLSYKVIFFYFCLLFTCSHGGGSRCTRQLYEKESSGVKNKLKSCQNEWPTNLALNAEQLVDRDEARKRIDPPEMRTGKNFKK